MIRWHHQLDGHEFEQVPGIVDGQGSLVSYSAWGHKELDMTEWRNWTALKSNHNCTNKCNIGNILILRIPRLSYMLKVFPVKSQNSFAHFFIALVVIFHICPCPPSDTQFNVIVSQCPFLNTRVEAWTPCYSPLSYSLHSLPRGNWIEFLSFMPIISNWLSPLNCIHSLVDW